MATILQALDAAVGYHQTGNLSEAERLYREILKRDPRHPDALHLLGLVAYARGDFAGAVEQIRKAIEADAAQHTFHNHLAEAYRALARLADAEASCRRALALQPDYAIGHNTLGTVQEAAGDLDGATTSFRRAIELDPEFAQAHFNLGLVRQSRGQLEEALASYRQAIACKSDYAAAYERVGAILREKKQTAEAMEAYRRAVQIDPTSATAHRDLGAIAQSQSKLDAAIDSYRRALALNPDDAGTHCNLGSALKDLGLTGEAVESYARALALKPDLAEAHFNLGVIQRKQRQWAAAEASFRQAIRAKPSSAEAYNHLGSIHRLQGKLTEAIECYQKALELRPDFAEVLGNLGNVFMLQGRRAEAIICYDQTLRMLPNYAPAHSNRALWRLAEGDFAAGWPEYEWRWKCEDGPKHTHAAPQWDGSPLEGRTLLVHAEQGLGDTLQFIRYVPPLVARGASVVVEVQPPLVRLLEQSGVGRVVAKGASLPQFDVQIPILSLPAAFGTTLETIPAEVPYLSADCRLIEHWRGVLADTNKFKVGIAWQGSLTNQSDRFRSIPLAHFAPLAQSNVELVSLQKGFGSEQLAQVARAFHVRDFGEALDRENGAFMDTAAIIKNLDLVITADTSTAHLAGALAAHVWVALPAAPDWRWQYERQDSPWYPTMRLFRQTSLDDWPGVFARLAEELRRVASEHR